MVINGSPIRTTQVQVIPMTNGVLRWEMAARSATGNGSFASFAQNGRDNMAVSSLAKEKSLMNGTKITKDDVLKELSGTEEESL